MVERTHARLSVGAQCQSLSISRSSFYYALKGETVMNLDLMLKVDSLGLKWPVKSAHRLIRVTDVTGFPKCFHLQQTYMLLLSDYISAAMYFHVEKPVTFITGVRPAAP